MPVTLKEVADKAGVTVSTASRALSADKSSLVNPDTRRRVQQAATELGYRGNVQASALRRGKSGTIGVIVADLSNPFLGPVLRGIASALGRSDLLPIMTETRDSSHDLKQICDKLLAQRVDGLIIAAGRYGDRTTLKRVASEVPTVLAVRALPGSGIPAVAHDDVTGGRLAAQHVLSLGHRSVAQLEGPQDIWSFAGRGQGFREGLAAADVVGIEIDANVHLPNMDAGRELATALLDGDYPLPTAVFAHNDSIAVGAMVTFREAGLSCPEDISIIGYNDMPLTDQLQPPLSTIRLPGFDLGRMAADLVVTRIDGTSGLTELVLLAPELVVRGSTAAPRPE